MVYHFIFITKGGSFLFKKMPKNPMKETSLQHAFNRLTKKTIRFISTLKKFDLLNAAFP